MTMIIIGILIAVVVFKAIKMEGRKSVTSAKLTPATEKGRVLEAEIAHFCEAFNGVKVLQNVLISKKNGGTTEIDVLILSTKGLFSIEAKNYDCQINGEILDSHLIADYGNGKEFKILNPRIQNKMHIAALNFGFPQYHFKNTVVFSNNTILDTGLITAKEIMSLDEFKTSFKDLLLSSKDVWTSSDVDYVFRSYKSYAGLDQTQHIAGLKKRHSA